MITVRDAAAQKGCTRAGLILAIHRGEIDAERFGNAWAIIQNQKFEAWTPNPIKQDSRLKGRPKKKRKA